MRMAAAVALLLAPLLAPLLAVGCAATKMYVGPDLPPETVALLHGGGRAHCRIEGPAPRRFLFTHFCAPLVRAVDGKALGPAQTDVYALEPGRHLIEAAFGLGGDWRGVKPDGSRRLRLEAEAGGRYRLYAERRYADSGEAWTYLWIEDMATGEVVAGERPWREPGA